MTDWKPADSAPKDRPFLAKDLTGHKMILRWVDWLGGDPRFYIDQSGLTEPLFGFELWMDLPK
jgi:hypothetical protein